MIKKENIIKEISSILATLKNHVELNNSINLTDINKSSEDFYAGFLNILYELNLTNFNELKSNYPSIDLGDEISRVCYQITATNSSDKIQDTLDKFHKNLLDTKFDELNLLILTNKKNYTKKFVSPTLSFHHTNIIDIKDLIKEIANIKSIDKLDKLLTFLKKELKIVSLEDTHSVFVENLIEFLNPEIKQNITNILRVKNKQGSIVFDLRDVLASFDVKAFSEMRNDEFNYLLYSQLQITEYEKYESQLLRIKSPEAKEIINLYSQFKVWNKYNDLFHMRIDEYEKFRKVLLPELSRWNLKSENIF